VSLCLINFHSANSYYHNQIIYENFLLLIKHAGDKNIKMNLKKSAENFVLQQEIKD